MASRGTVGVEFNTFDATAFRVTLSAMTTDVAS